MTVMTIAMMKVVTLAGTADPRLISHRLEQIAVEPAHSYFFFAAAQGEAEFAGFVAAHGVYRGSTHHGAPVDLPEVLTVKLG